MALMCGRGAAQLASYINNGTLDSSSPTLVIDATNFINNGTFDLSISGFDAGQFDFSDVLNYTNRGVMYCDQGFLFNDSPSGTGSIRPSANFVNQNPGQIYAGAAVPDLPPNFFLGLTGAGPAPQIIISATNITSSGLLQVGQAGRISAKGNALNLSHSAMIVEGFDQAGSGLITGGVDLGLGEFIQYWGGGTESNNFFYGNLRVPGTATAPSSAVTFNDHTTGFAGFSIQGLTLANAIAITNDVSPSNFVTQVVIFADTGPNNDGNSLVQMGAFFLPAGTTPISTNLFRTAVIKWGVQLTNAFGQIVTNTLYLTDDLGSLPTNVTFITNNITLHGLTELVPTNYAMLTSFNDRSLTNTGNTAYRQSLFTNAFGTNGDGSGEVTNEYAAFSVNLAPVTAQPDPLVAGSTVSNVSGRAEIIASQSLDLTGAIINAGNYLNLASTNHYAGSQGAQVTFPFADINLGSTNGQMSISNLVSPYLTRFSGPIQAWSGAWSNLTSGSNIVITATATNTNSFTITNAFMVTIVVSSLSPTSPVNLESLSLRSTNLVISDLLTVNNNLLLNTQNLTITSNAPDDVTPLGALLFFPPISYPFYSVFVPNMQNFTNYGVMETEDAAYFQVRLDPNIQSAGDGPWQSVVNHGEIINAFGGVSFWANYFENSTPPLPSVINPNFIECDTGPLTVQSSTAVITNGTMLAAVGDMSLTGGSLTIANSILSSSGFLDLAATNLLTDLIPAGAGPVTTGNTFSSGDGFSLLTAPTALSGLLGTSITSGCRTNAVCENTWAGLPDLALVTNVGTPLPTMANNVPLGQLILDGGNNNSVFHFAGPDAVNPYAMYVDQIELADGATNFVGGKYTAFNIDPNVTIYFLKASIGAGDISTNLQAAGGGRLVWLRNNVGHFSVTKVTYADGQSFAVNSAYVQAYGLPPEPPVPLTAQNIQLQIAATTVNSTPMAAISWYAQAHSTNTLYYRTLTNPNWLVRTNFVQGTTPGRVTNFDSLGAGHLYKVSVAQ